MTPICRINIIKTIFSQIPTRSYAQYPTYYQEPIINKKKLEEFMKDKNEKEMNEIYVKAAKGDVTCSVFYDADVALMTNYLMRQGKKNLARFLIEKTFETIKRIQLDKYYSSEPDARDKIELSPLEIFHKAVENCTPVLQTRKLKRGGVWYTIPAMVAPSRAKFLAMNFLIEAAQAKGDNDRFTDAFANEILSAYKSSGKAFQRKVDLHKYCEANRAYAHYRWS